MASTFSFTRKTGSNSLNSNLGAKPVVPGYPDAGFQGHHIIPVAAFTTSVQDAIKRGYRAINEDFDVDHRSNGIWLPTDEDVAAEMDRALHRQTDGGLHSVYTSFLTNIMDDLTDKFSSSLQKSFNRITRSNAKNKEQLREKTEKSHGRVLEKIIEYKIKNNTEKFLSDQPLVGNSIFVNYKDPALESAYTDLQISSGNTDFNYDDFISNSANLTAVRLFYTAEFQPSARQITGAIRFKGVHITEEEDRRKGGDGGSSKGKAFLAPFSVREIKKTLEEFVDAASGKKGPVYLATSALAFYAMFEIVRGLIPDELNFDDADVFALLQDAINDQIDGFQDFSLDTLKDIAADTLTDPAFIIGVIARLLVPSFGWVATIYEVVDNFDFIVAALQLAYYAFDDPSSAFGAAIEAINDLLAEVVEWAEWFGIEFEVDEEPVPDSDGDTVLEQDFAEVQEGLQPVVEEFTEDIPREDRGQSAQDIVPDSVTFDGVLYIAPSFDESTAASNQLHVTDYLREIQGIREEFSSEFQAQFEELALNFALFGGAEQDYISGGIGDDAYYGKGGDDVFIGGVGADYIVGGDETNENFGDNVVYGYDEQIVVLDPQGNEQTFEYETLTLTLGAADVHMTVSKEYTGGRPTELDRLAGIETIILSRKTDNIIIKDETVEFIPTLWRIDGGDDQERDPGTITIDGDGGVRAISIDDGIGYITDEEIASTPSYADFRDAGLGGISKVIKKHSTEQPLPSGAQQDAQSPEDADNYIELSNLEASFVGSDGNEDFWNFGASTREVLGNGGEDIIVLGDSRTMEEVESDGKGRSQADGGEGNDVVIARGEQVDASGGDGEDIVVGVGLRGKQGASRPILSGGAGDDIVLSYGGEGAAVFGGNGRDLIFAATSGAQIFGDTIDGLSLDGSDLASSENSDNIWFWPGTVLNDARPNDVLQFFGYPLVGGNNNLPMGLGGGLLGQFGVGLGTFASPLFFDYFLPFFVYMKIGEDLFVANIFTNFLGSDKLSETGDGTSTQGAMVIRDFQAPATIWGARLLDTEFKGDLGMAFKVANPFLAILAMIPIPAFGAITKALPLIDELLTLAGAATRLGKSIAWRDGVDPLVLDLDGDGIETIALSQSPVYFDVDGDFFAERTGWLDADDGFLVLDKNKNGLIDDINEMFGDATQFGFEELALYDSNGDGVIDAADLIWSDLQVWRDLDGDGVTDDGELDSLEDIGIVSIDAGGTPVAVDENGDNALFQTPQGTTLRERGTFRWETGETGNIFEALFELNDVDTIFRGEKGVAPWLRGDQLLDSPGFGRVADLAVDASNDFYLQQLTVTAAANMTVPKLKELRALSGPVLGQWSYALELTRELTPVLLADSADGPVLADYGVYQEDATGGFWTLNSGAPILAGDGSEVARATLQDVLAQSTAADQGWQLEQMFSPSTRPEALLHRKNAPYLAEIVNGRAVVLDHGIYNGDSTWSLASGNDVLAEDGSVIAAPTLEDIRAQSVAEGQEWRVEEISFNPYAAIEVENIGVYFIDGIVVDYTVEVTDRDGSFYVWARNLDRALELQDKFGTPRDFNLRNFEVDFDTLDEVGSTDDSTFRVELLTPGQFHFATSLVGTDFQPEMLTATIAEATGVIDYKVSENGGPSLVDGEYVSAIKGMIEFLDVVMETYVEVSRKFAVRLAVQGGLKDLAREIEYSVEDDVYRATGDRELAPMFEAIFEAAPAGFEPAYDYLTDWNEILWMIYPEFELDGTGNIFGSTQTIDQRWVFQYMLPAFETVGIDLDIRAAMNALSINENLLIDHAPDATDVDGTNRLDFIYLSEGDQTYRGGIGADVYFVGQNFGSDIIEDIDFGDGDELRFAHITSEQVIATREGQDLHLTTAGSADYLIVKNHFLGERNPAFGNTEQDTAMASVYFADGVIWSPFQVAQAVSNPQDTADIIIGSGATDVLEGGKGNDVLEGREGGDFYVFGRGDGQDIIRENAGFTRLPSKMGLDFLQFVGEDLSVEHLRLSRDGESPDLKIELEDNDGNFTGDRIIIEDMFDGLVLNLGDFLGQFDASLDFDYIAPNLIERFIFEDGTSLDFEEIAQLVIDNAKTVGEDAVYGFLIADDLDGGTGDDVVVGREGDDTYFYGRNYGSDVMFDGDFSVDLFGTGKDGDKLVFRDGLTWVDFTFLREGASDTIEMVVNGTVDPDTGDRDSVILTEIFKTGLFQGFINLIDTLVFADGTEWHYTKLAQHLIDISRTDGDDIIYGWFLSDTMDGGTGNDQLFGFGGSDQYIFQKGYGQDVVIDTGGGGDKLLMQDITFDEVEVSRDGKDLIFTLVDENGDPTGDRVTLQDQYDRYNAQGRAVEEFVFSDQTINFTQLNPHVMDVVGTGGNDVLEGSDFAETIDGRAGDDTLIGGSDGDIYKFDVGYNDDLIIDQQVATYWQNRRGGRDKETDDRILFGDDITIDNVVFTKDANDLVITVEGRTDSLRIRNQFRSIEEGVELFEFQSGDILHISDVEERLAIVGGNRGDNTITGSVDNPNVLDGRQGDDLLEGGRAGDIYAFGAAYDLDEIRERTDGFADAVDRVVFGSTVSRENIIIRRDGDDLVFDLGNGEDQLTITQGLTSRRIEEYLFADGSTVTFDEIQELLLQGTDGDDQILGFDGRNDRIEGGEGSDALNGGTGDDSYYFEAGFGQDAITEAGGSDQVIFGPGLLISDIEFTTEGDNLVVTFQGQTDTLVIFDGLSRSATQFNVETFVFDDGTVLSLEDIRARLLDDASTFGNDVLDARIGAAITFDGSRGNDMVYLGGDQTFLFTAGDGFVEISTADSTGGDRIELTGLGSDEVTVRRPDLDGPDFLLTFESTGDRVTLRDALNGVTPTIVFADGAEWGAAELAAALVTAQVSDLDDLVTGTRLDDRIEAGLGDDDIQGGAGDDTIVFARGDGRDVVLDSAGASDRVDIIGYLPEDLIVARPVQDRDEVIITFKGTDDRLVLRYVGDQGIEALVFQDGTIWDKTYLYDISTSQGSQFDDVIVGSETGEVISGGGGDDSLEGGAGNDTYEVGLGGGNDVIYDFDPSGGIDRLKLLDFAPFEITLSRTLNALSDVIITLPTGNTITLRDQLNGDPASQVEEIEFATGEIWDLVAINARLAEDSKRTGLVVGNASNQTYTHYQGEGSYSIHDYGRFTNDDRLILPDTASTEVTWTREGADYVLTLDNGEAIRLLNQGNSSEWGTRYVEFSDGVTLQRAEINNILVSDAKPTGLVTGSSEFETYRHTQGDGSYTISDYGRFTNDDRLIFTDTASTEVLWGRDGADYTITLPNGEEIRLLNQGNSSEWGTRYVEFSDGVTVQRAEINSILVADQKADGAVVTGSSEFETYRHTQGDGSYTISDYGRFTNDDRLIFTDTASTEVLWGRDGADYTITLPNAEVVRLRNQSDSSEWGTRYVNFPMVLFLSGRRSTTLSSLIRRRAGLSLVRRSSKPIVIPRVMARTRSATMAGLPMTTA